MPRGGKRPGAGRPRAPEASVTRSVVLTRAAARQLAELAEAASCSESRVVRDALDALWSEKQPEIEAHKALGVGR